MAEFTMTRVESEAFEKACMACVNAFRCFLYKLNDVVEITSIESGDMEIIRDTLMETGSKLIDLAIIEE